MSFPVALQLFTVRNECKANFYGTLKKIKEMGYDGVEFAGLHNHTVEELKEMLEDIGLEAVSAHVPYKDMEENPAVFAEYAKLGCKYIVVPYLTEEYRPGAPRFDEMVANLSKFGKVANENGMTLLYHNHDFEYTTINGKYALDIIYDTVPADLLQTEIDTCWANVGGVVPAEYVRKYTGRAPVVHLKDFWGEKSENMYELIGIETKPVRPEGFEFRPVGSGKQDFPAILAASKDAGALWVVVEQDSPAMGLTPLECAKKSIDYVKTINK
ncbi:MAG: sugar phosphate isomerase/epimerase [Clostridia bacterium]|nr:sugar phosphate isomerase/epimerase [Clostridia bacterium]